MLADLDIERIRTARHGDPFAVLGPHADADGRTWVRAFLPGAVDVDVIGAGDDASVRSRLACRHADGFFEGSLTEPTGASRLRVRGAMTLTTTVADALLDQLTIA